MIAGAPFHFPNERPAHVTTKPKRQPNPTPITPKVGATLYLFDPHEGVVSAVVTKVERDRVILSADCATYVVQPFSVFASFEECAAAEGIATPKPKRGRPRSPVDRPQRTLGRVAEADWQTLQEAARIAGTTFTTFALSTLLPAARRVIAKGRA